MKDFVPDLIVEVLSPSTAPEDRGPKKSEYERLGVREYYLLDPVAGEVEAFALAGARYVAVTRGPDGFPSAVLDASWDPARVLADG